MRPGLANAFLLGFVESMADFGNPLVLGGNFEVLSTKIFFAVVGAAHDQGQAAVLAIVLLAFTLGAFWLQQRWLGGKIYTTVTGKGDAGLPTPLPRRVDRGSSAAVIVPWVAADGRDLRRHPGRRLRQHDGPRLHADAGALPHRLRRSTSADGSILRGLGLELLLHDDQGRGDLGAADGADRPAHRLSADAPALRAAGGCSNSRPC